MKLEIVNPVAVSKRCQYRTASGRQCRLAPSDVHSGLCSRHLAQRKRKEASDIRAELSKYCQGFLTAQGINHSLSALYLLLAENRVSARRAAVLAYIASQLLRTLPAIDYDREHGITVQGDSAPQPTPVSGPDPNPADPAPLSNTEDKAS